MSQELVNKTLVLTIKYVCLRPTGNDNLIGSNLQVTKLGFPHDNVMILSLISLLILINTCT